MTPGDLGRPLRAVVFGGAFFEPAALEFLARLDEHPEVELLGVFCQSRGFGLRRRVADVARRRKALAVPILAAQAAAAALRFARAPGETLSRARRARRALRRAAAVPDLHAPAVRDRVRALRPDLGLSYGSPLLRPELFEIPALGTLGIHHGKLPGYRGVKTTFWAVHNGEPEAGVTIQRLNAGLDTGEVVREGSVGTAGKRYGRVAAEAEALGIELFVDAVLAVKRGEARPRPQWDGVSTMYRQPGARDFLRLWRRQFAGPRRGV
ncbi:MAG: formyltransferase family protein [Deferrisomatales bacterium]|nr:formyltransferase family protein [Deferrisomatales bacterium]